MYIKVETKRFTFERFPGKMGWHIESMITGEVILYNGMLRDKGIINFFKFYFNRENLYNWFIQKKPYTFDVDEELRNAGFEVIDYDEAVYIDGQFVEAQPFDVDAEPFMV